MTVTIFKFIHVATICLWSAGLIALPFVYLQRKGMEGEALYRIHAFTRALYVNFVSPAAFIAIGSGTVLIFLQATYVPWFTAKLVLVAAMTGLHIFSGLVILRLFEPDRSYPMWRFIAMTTLSVGVIGGILLLVLGKPELAEYDDFEGFFAPGALGEMLGGFIAWTR
jgi:uncharacterized membrane protein